MGSIPSTTKVARKKPKGDIAMARTTKKITTEVELDRHIDSLSVTQLRKIVKYIAYEWYVEDDDTLNRDKGLDSDTIQDITQMLSSHGIWPTA